MKITHLVWLAALLLALQPITTDLYLPGLPWLQSEVQASSNEVQQTLTALLLVFGLSQLLWGELADRFGRRRILLAGLILHALSAMMCTLTLSIGWVIFWRAVQGAGLGAVIISARALIHERAAAGKSIQTLGRSLTVVAVIATLTIPAGGLIVTLLHWKFSLLLPGIASFLLMLWVFSGLQETTPEKHTTHQQRLAWRHILREPVFYRFTLLNSLSFTTLISLLSSSPFLFIHSLQYSPAHYGLAMCLILSGFSLGTLLCRRLLTKTGLHKTLLAGAALNMAALLLTSALWFSGQISLTLFVPAGMLFTLSHGIHHTCSQGRVLQPFPSRAATVAALNGCLLMVISFSVNTVLGVITDVAERVFIPLIILNFFCALFSLWSFLLPQNETAGEPLPSPSDAEKSA